MKPDWDKLMKEFKNSETTIVADVDCTAAGEELCSTHGVEGYPSLKFGDPNALEDYEGDREFGALRDFAKGLKPSCSPSNPDLCEGEEREKLDALMATPNEELSEKIAAEEKKIVDAEETFKKEVDELQERYEKLEKEKAAVTKEVKAGGLGLMKAVLAKKTKDDDGSPRDDL